MYQVTPAPVAETRKLITLSRNDRAFLDKILKELEDESSAVKKKVRPRRKSGAKRKAKRASAKKVAVKKKAASKKTAAKRKAPHKLKR